MTGMKSRAEPRTDTSRKVHRNTLSRTCATNFQSCTTCIKSQTNMFWILLPCNKIVSSIKTCNYICWSEDGVKFRICQLKDRKQLWLFCYATKRKCNGFLKNEKLTFYQNINVRTFDFCNVSKASHLSDLVLLDHMHGDITNRLQRCLQVIPRGQRMVVVWVGAHHPDPYHSSSS